MEMPPGAPQASFCDPATPYTSAPSICPDRPGLFSDCYERIGIDVGAVSWPIRVGPNNAAAIADCDGDGLPEIFSHNWIGESRLWKNRGGFRFEDVTAAAGVATKDVTVAGFGDLDGDGLPDLVVVFSIGPLVDYMQLGTLPVVDEVRVLRNKGDCRFEDVSVAWGFGKRSSNTPILVTAINLTDVNLDGRLDLLVTPSQDVRGPPWLYLSRPDGTWADEQKDALGPTGGSCWGSYISDLDHDGFDDLFLFYDGREGTPARFFHRVPVVGPPRFEQRIFDPLIDGDTALEVSLMAGFDAEVDGDGLVDHYIADIGPSHLYLRRGGKLVDLGKETNADAGRLMNGAPTLAYSCSAADYDNDMWPDIAVAAGVDDGFMDPPHAFLLHNRGDGTFESAMPLLDQKGPHKQQWMTASDLDRDGQGSEVHSLRNPAVTALQDAYVRKVVDTVNDLDNVLYEVCNEAYGESQDWQAHVISVVKAYEATKGRAHPVGMTVEWPGGDNAELFASQADWISPNSSGGYFDNPPPADGRKVIVNDTDHLCYPCGDASFVWRSVTRGLNPAFMDAYDCQSDVESGCNPNEPVWVATRANLGYARTVTGRVNLAAMTPRPDLCSSTYCLANPAASGAEYLAFLPAGGSVTLDLSATTRSLSVEWFNPASGGFVAAAAVTGGAPRSISAPFDGPAVVLVRDGSVATADAPAVPQRFRILR